MEWRERDYEMEKRRIKNLETTKVSSHPLKAINITNKQIKPLISNPLSTNDSSVSFEDPLSMFQVEEEVRPSQDTNQNKKDANRVVGESWEEWRSKILVTFTTTQKLTFQVASKGEVTVAEKVKTQLQQLDDLEEGSVQTRTTLTQKEYISHIQELSGSLQKAWKEDQRVKTLKLAIQCSKLLSDTAIPSFYPSKLILITDVLSIFSSLVFRRLLKKSSAATEEQDEMKENIFGVDVYSNVITDTAKETCRNWLYKIASIRELLPRLYLEISVLPCLRFLSSLGDQQSWKRLLMSCRGVSDVLVACYLRCYLAKVIDLTSVSSSSSSSSSSSAAFYPPSSLSSSSSSISSTTTTAAVTTTSSDPFTFPPSLPPPPSPSTIIILAIKDSIYSLIHHRKSSFTNDLTYLRLFSPAFDWLFRCYIRASQKEGKEVKCSSTLFSLVGKCDDDAIRSMLIGCFIDQSPSSFLSDHVMQIDQLIGEVEGSNVCYTMTDLLMKLGTGVGTGKGMKAPKELLTMVWGRLATCESVKDYIWCVVEWSGFVRSQFGRREVVLVMKDVVHKVTPQRQFEHLQGPLTTILLTLLSCNNSPLQHTITSPYFMTYLNIITTQSKPNLCKNILNLFLDEMKGPLIDTPTIPPNSSHNSISDPVLIHSLMTLCRVVHDDITPVSLDDLVRDVGGLLIQVVSLIDTHTPDSQLKFYVECRASLCNIDAVVVFLVHRVNHLQTTLSAPSTSFRRACSAYSFITIPSINGPFHKINLSIASSLVSLRSGCLSQASDFVDFSIDLFATIPRYIYVDSKANHTESTSYQALRHLLSLLVILPDRLHLPPLSHYKHLHSILTTYEWDDSRDTKALVLAVFLVSLNTTRQENYPYHIKSVVSNDLLYGSDPKFLKEVDKLSGSVVEELIVCVNNLPAIVMSQTIPKLFNILVGHVRPSSQIFKIFNSKLPTGNQSIKTRLLRRDGANRNILSPLTS